MYTSALLLTYLVFITLSFTTATYKADQLGLFGSFGKVSPVFEAKPVSINKISEEYTEIMHRNCKGEREKRKSVINKQKDLGLINWATVYQAKPSGTLLHNIEFDHIPPGSAFPDGVNEDLFKNQAPTLAISNYDHRSALWKQCSTTSGDAPIMGKYKEFVQAGKHMCAIFANIFCIKDIENYVSNIERISETSAFERYKDGLKSLINLHYQFGRENNKAINFKDKVSSAYCEIPIEDPVSPPSDTGCKPGNLIKEDPKMYCKNVGKSFEKCNGHERNLKKTEYDMLNEWIAGTKSDNDLLGACDLDKDGWKALFPKIDWDYKPTEDTNPDGSDGTCVRYERKWMKGPEEKIEEESKKEKIEEKKEEMNEESEESEGGECGKVVDKGSGSGSEKMELD